MAFLLITGQFSRLSRLSAVRGDPSWRLIAIVCAGLCTLRCFSALALGQRPHLLAIVTSSRGLQQLLYA